MWNIDRHGSSLSGRTLHLKNGSWREGSRFAVTTVSAINCQQGSRSGRNNSDCSHNCEGAFLAKVADIRYANRLLSTVNTSKENITSTDRSLRLTHKALEVAGWKILMFDKLTHPILSQNKASWYQPLQLSPWCRPHPWHSRKDSVQTTLLSTWDILYVHELWPESGLIAIRAG